MTDTPTPDAGTETPAGDVSTDTDTSKTETPDATDTSEKDSGGTILTDDSKADDADKTAEGDKGEKDDKQGGDKEPLELQVEVTDELKDFSEDIGKFNEFLGGFLKDTPNPTPQDLMNAAVQFQAKAAREQLAEFDRQVDTWGKEAKADKELMEGGYDENVAIAKAAIQKLGSPELAEVLNSSGLGSHPAMIRFALKAGKMLSEDDVVTAENAGGGATDGLAARYPKSSK
ncbi:MAG: hypothetical protein AAFY25_04830 [Pseudomonadota bacterium]